VRHSYLTRASHLQPGQVFRCATGNLFNLKVHSLEVDSGKVNIKGKHEFHPDFYRLSLPVFALVIVRGAR
jgi:hypothetical protein